MSFVQSTSTLLKSTCEILLLKLLARHMSECVSSSYPVVQSISITLAPLGTTSHVQIPPSPSTSITLPAPPPVPEQYTHDWLQADGTGSHSTPRHLLDTCMTRQKSCKGGSQSNH